MSLREATRRALVCLVFSFALGSDVMGTGCCGTCCGNCVPPGVDACNDFIQTLPEPCIFSVPPLISCEVYDDEEYAGCDFEDYFACLTDVVACDPETGEPNVTAWLPCAAFTDFAHCLPPSGE